MNNFKMPGNVKVTNPADLPTGGRKIKVLFRLWRYMGRYWYGYLAAFLLNVIANLLALEGPKLSGFAISAIEPGTGRVDFDTVVHYCILMALLYVLSSVLSYVQQILMIHRDRPADALRYFRQAHADACGIFRQAPVRRHHLAHFL